MNSHDLARRLFELPDLPTDVESVSVVVRHAGGSTSEVTDHEYHLKCNDDAPQGDCAEAESIVLHPYPDAR